jgi:ABC-type transport system involved in cytochrome c biogenesis permease subunit
MACITPITIAARYFEVYYDKKHFGSFPPASPALWGTIFLGILSLFTALAFNACNVPWGKRFGLILSLYGILLSLAFAATDFLKYHHLYIKFHSVLAGIVGTWFYGMLLRFVVKYYGKMRAEDA